MQLKIFGITGEYAICHGDGHILYEAVKGIFYDHPGEIVELSFEGVRVFHFSFFRIFFSQLVKEFSLVNVKDKLEFTNITGDGWEVLQGVFKSYANN